MTAALDPLFGDFASALRSLADPATRHRPGLMYALSGATPAELVAWAEIWPTIPAERRRWIAERMSETSEADFHLDFRPLFAAALDDADPLVRATAADGLWESTDLGLVDRFTRLIEHDPDNRVRARAAAALGVFVERGEIEPRAAPRVAPAVDRLIAVAGDEAEDIEVRRRAIESVGFSEREAVRHVIARAYASRPVSLRAGALRAMGHSADSRWGPEVLAGLEQPEPEMRFEAAHAAGELSLRDAIPQLAILSNEDPDRSVRIEAVWALGEIGGPSARRALERLAARLDEDEEEDLVSAIDDAISTVALSDGDMTFSGFDVTTGAEARAATAYAARNGGDDDDQDEDDLGDEDLEDLEDMDGLEGIEDLDDLDDLDLEEDELALEDLEDIEEEDWDALEWGELEDGDEMDGNGVRGGTPGP